MDIYILDLIQKIRNPFLDGFFRLYTRLGDHAELWFFIILVFALFKKTRRIAFIALIALVAEVFLVNVMLKPLFMRPRPYILLDFELILKAPVGSSFPSGHTASSFAVAFIFYFNRTPLRKTFLFLAALMGFSRAYLYVHYPTDIIFGVMTGVAVALAIYYMQDKIIYFFRPYVKKFID